MARKNKYEVWDSAARSIATAKGWLKRTGPYPHEAHVEHVKRLRSLSDDQVRDVRLRLAAGETQTSVSKRFGVSQSVISQINSGRTYKDVV